MNDSLLIVLQLPETDSKSLDEEINEMILLAKTLNYNVCDTIIQKKTKIDTSTYIGKGKLESIINICNEMKIKTMFINDELKPSHFKKIQSLCGKSIKLIDRTWLILDIFQNHAKTKEAKTQVELAKVQYMMPRLVGMWTHLERQEGGTGVRGGPGEKQIEIDRRLLRKNVDRLKKDLLKIDVQRRTQRKSRTNIFKVAIAGYTNAGKSSLLRALTGYEALIKDQLFATLDTTSKKVTFKGDTEIIISDTVGFLRKLPHDLIASFRSTLGDINDADIIIKLIDISSSDIEGHISTIDNTLKYLECDNKKSILIFNKIDIVSDHNLFKRINDKYNNPIMISSLKKLRINKLINFIYELANDRFTSYTLSSKHDNAIFIKEIYSRAKCIEKKSDYTKITFKFKSTIENYKYLKKLI